MENPDSVDQKRQRLFQVLADHARLLGRQGTVQATWRPYQGRRLGPFFRLAFRVEGRPRSIYLGADQALAAEVRRWLHELQAPLRAKRQLERIKTLARRAARVQRRDLDRELRQRGLYLKGHEIRGGTGLRGPFPAGPG